MSGPLVSLVIVNYGTPELVEAQLDSLQRHDDRHLVKEAIVVDNGHPIQRAAATLVRSAAYSFPVRFIANAKSGYAEGANAGARTATGEYVAIANSDVSWSPAPALAPLLDGLSHDQRASCAGPQLLFPDGAWQRSYGPVPSLREALGGLFLVELAKCALEAARLAPHDAAPPPRAVPYLSGAFLLFRRAVYHALGGMDETFPFYVEDADIALRAARAGSHALFVPRARLVHVGGASSSRGDAEAYARRLYDARRTFVARHEGTRRAAWYAALQRVAATEIAAVYALLAPFTPTAAWRRRRARAFAGFRAAWGRDQPQVM